MKLTKYLILLPLLFLSGTVLFGQYNNTSVLSEGDVYKLSVENTGIYKIDYAFLGSIDGLDVDNINPKNIKIYTQHGGIVPQSLIEDRVDDLNEVPLFIRGEDDGSFDPGDFILLYMEGADRFVVSGQAIEFEKNVYDLRNYFFLKTEGGPGKRVASSGPAMVNTYSKTTESIRRHEKDRLNLLGNFGGTQGSGKKWYGESFANDPEQNFDSDFRFPHLVSGSTAELSVQFISRSAQSASFEVVVDGQRFERSVSFTNTGDIEAVYGRIGFINDIVSLNNTSPEVLVRYLPRVSNSEGWLDFIQMVTDEYLNYTGQEMKIFRRDSRQANTFGYEITTKDQLRIWDVTQQSLITEMASSFDGSLQRFSYLTQNQVRVFYAFNENAVTKAPRFEKKLENQNLHALERADLAIVYYKDFRSAAEKLRDHRKNHSQMAVIAADIEQVYNEFGGGKKDPSALRDFAKMLYDRDPNFRYLLLMGDASYDFRGLDPNLDYQNFVPTYETDESLHPIESFPSDDFFALLSDNEGDDSLDGAIDIGVGRIPCKTAAEADAVVRKIMNYDLSPSTLGEWRMRIGFAADDEDSAVHMIQADGIARLTEANHPEMIQQKVYFDAYNQESTPGGARYPDARSALSDNLQKGQLVLNYLGHGGPKGWAQERVLQLSDISNLNNFDKLPILITATCSFTGFDEPSVVSAGELALLSPKGGAVALFSTVRAVYSSQNARITREVFKKIFTRNEGQRLTLGDIIKEAQNQNSSDTISSNTRKFMLFGDPSQTIALPLYNIKIDEFNGEPVNENKSDTLGALSRSRLEGHIEDFLGNAVPDFNGEIVISVFDKASQLKTLDNDNGGRNFEFEARRNILYKGKASVVNGEFAIEFILPKDINFQYGKGLLSFYASDNTSRDAGGYYDQIVIGGTSTGEISDNTGPDIKIYFNDRSFLPGGEVGQNAIMIVDLEDENGINLSSTSIGHDITAVFDNEENNPVILNEFYSPASNALGAGTVNYNLNGLEPGLHKVRIKAWDVLNNSSEAEVEFMVVGEEEGFIRNIVTTPNPAQSGQDINIGFDHDLVNSNIQIDISLFSLSGQYIGKIQEERFSSGSRVSIPLSNGNGFSRNLAEGFYIYKINIRSDELNLQRESNFQKLVIVK